MLKRSLTSNLGPFNAPISIHLCEVHRSHSTVLGIVTLPAQTFKRSSMVEDWFPVIPVSDYAENPSVEARGELSLSIRVQEDMVLPLEGYIELDQVGYSALQSNV